jgi:long-chain acyl-CoA synthetase
MLLHQLFEATAQRRPDKVALVCGNVRLSYAEIDRRSLRLAGYLHRQGIASGERVGLFLDNGPDMVIAILALLRLGAVCMAFNPQTKADKLAAVLARTRAAALLTQASLAMTWRKSVETVPQLRMLLVSGQGWQPASIRERPWPDTTEDGQDVTHVDAGIDEQSLAFISHTSGTTGLPKGVMLSHRNLVSATRTIAGYLALREDDVILSALPLSFNYGLTQLLTAFATGAALVLERSFAFPVKTLETLARERATVFPAVPTMYAMLLGLQDLSRWDLSSLRLMTSASAPLPETLLRQLRDSLPAVQLYVMYGQTECTRISYLPPEQLDRRPGSVGRGLPGQACWLIDEHGQRLPHGSTGELVVQGDHVMPGYWEDRGRTAEKLFIDPDSGRVAMRTGDLFRSDDEGWLYFVARKDDIIKTRGEKVSPHEVEHAIMAIAGVRECAVSGVPDAVLGEAVQAHVVLEGGAVLSERDIIRHCLARLESHMAPKHVAFLDALPRTDTGKVSKRLLA